MIGIFAPYQRGEVTAAALRLADLALSQGYEVKLATCAPIDKNVHPFWDSKARSTKGDGVYKWANGCSKIFWFDYNSKVQRAARLPAEKAMFYWIPMWHRLSLDQPPNIEDFFRVVCPLSHCMTVLGNNFTSFDKDKLTWCLWDSGITPIVRAFESQHPRFYLPMDSGAVDETSLFTLRVIEELMLVAPTAIVTIDSDKAWPRRAKTDLRRLATRWPGRLKLCLRTSFVDQIQHFHQNDWTFIPAVRNNTGIMAMRSLACGTPVITYNIPPFSNLIQDGNRGLLIPVDRTTTWSGAQIAVPSLGMTLQVLRQASNPDVIQHCSSQDWRLPRHQETFERFWKAQFEVD